MPISVVTVAEGAVKLRKLLNSLSAQCPDSKFSLSGYSKGAIVLHNTDLPPDVQAKVVAVAVFGVRNYDSSSLESTNFDSSAGPKSEDW